MRHVGDYLKLYLEQSKISIYQAAKRSGINRTTLQKVLSGDRNPSKSMLLALILVLNRTLAVMESI